MVAVSHYLRLSVTLEIVAIRAIWEADLPCYQTKLTHEK